MDNRLERPPQDQEWDRNGTGMRGKVLPIECSMERETIVLNSTSALPTFSGPLRCGQTCLPSRSLTGYSDNTAPEPCFATPQGSGELPEES